jgi:molybdopterin/thiamine biosynthesis adenylyltransferase
MGVKRIGLFDDSIVTEADTNNCFYFSKSNIGTTTKAQACAETLKPLSINT